jgi:hypothetical protein
MNILAGYKRIGFNIPTPVDRMAPIDGVKLLPSPFYEVALKEALPLRDQGQ